MPFDVDAVRSAFPALEHGVAHFDGPGGSQTPALVARAVADALCAGIANQGSVTTAERRATAVVTAAREAVADLLGCERRGVVFGRSMTQLTYDMSRALAKGWRSGDEIVVTRLDHDANVRPWVQAAEAVGATVRWVEFDRDTCELAVSAVEAVLSSRTKLVAFTAASNLLGTRPDVAAITRAVRDAGALAYVDGVHLTPHAPVDVRQLGADFFVCSPYKFFGPHLGVLVAQPTLLESVHPDKLQPSSNAVPDRFELGTLPYELLAGVSATVGFLAGLAPGDGDPRARVLAGMSALQAHEDQLFDRLAEGLHGLPGVTVFGRPACHTPTVLFSVRGREPSEVHELLAKRDVNAPAGSFYAIEPSRWLGLGERGAVRAGLAPYTNDEDVDRLLNGVAEVCG